MSTRGGLGFTNPYSSSFEDNKLFFLSFGVPAKPGIAKNLMTLAGRLLQTSLTNFKLKKYVFHIPHKMLQANKVLMLARSSKKKLPNLQYVNSQMRA